MVRGPHRGCLDSYSRRAHPAACPGQEPKENFQSRFSWAEAVPLGGVGRVLCLDAFRCCCGSLWGRLTWRLWKWKRSPQLLNGRPRQTLTMERAREEGAQERGEGEQPMEGKPMKKNLGLHGAHCSVGSSGGLVCRRQRGLSPVAQVQLLLLLLLRWRHLHAYRRAHFANACSRRGREEEGLQPPGELSEEGAA